VSATGWIVLLWLGFAGSHLLLSHPPIRRALREGVGEGPFQGLYSLVAIGFFVPLVWVYFANLHGGTWLWPPARSPIVSWPLQAALGFAFVLLAAGIVRPSPASMTGAPAASVARVGAFRITRPPLVMALGLVGLLHLPLNGSSVDVAFFAGLPLFALVGCWHQDRRKLLEGLPGYAAFVAATPFLPFSRGGWVTGLSEIPPLAWAVGLGLAVVVRWAHVLWQG